MWTPESLLWDEARQWGPSRMSQVTALNLSPCMWSTGRRLFQDLCSPERFVSTVQGPISLRILLIRIVQRNKTDRMCMCMCVTHTYIYTCMWGWGFPGDSMVKNAPASAGDASSIPGVGRSPGGGHGNPLQYSYLGNPKDRGSCRATVHGEAKE